MNLTAAQIKVIQTWTEERDALLREIGNYSTELGELKKSTKAEGLALADLHTSIAEARGRISELEALETRYRGSLATDISTLEVRKSRLEGECVLLEEKIKGGNEQYVIVTAATETLQSANDTMKDQAAIVNTVVGDIIKTSQVHISDMDVLVARIKTVATDVIDRGEQNVAQANLLIETVPLFVAKLQKSISIPRKYPEGHPRFVKTE